MSELKQFKLPDVGEGLTEADIVKWHVQPGDKVTINQIIVEIETAKAVVELPSPFEGVISELFVAEGTTVDVGTPIVSVSTGEGGAVGEGGAAAPAGVSPAEVSPAEVSPAEVSPAELSTVAGDAAGGQRSGAVALPAAEAVAGT